MHPIYFGLRAPINIPSYITSTDTLKAKPSKFHPISSGFEGVKSG